VDNHSTISKGMKTHNSECQLLVGIFLRPWDSNPGSSKGLPTFYRIMLYPTELSLLVTESFELNLFERSTGLNPINKYSQI
jgi:hypothetical protein